MILLIGEGIKNCKGWPGSNAKMISECANKIVPSPIIKLSPAYNKSYFEVRAPSRLTGGWIVDRDWCKVLRAR